jgi:hypothetical protein
MATHEIKRNDTRPYWPVTLTYEDDTAVNLSSVQSVFLHVRPRSSTIVQFSVAVTVTDGPNGEVEWRPLAAETDTSGHFRCEWEVTFADGTVQTFPTRGYDRLIVLGDIA